MKAELLTSCNFLAWTQGTGLAVVERDMDSLYASCVKFTQVHEPHFPSPGFKCKCGQLVHKPVHIVLATRVKDYYETQISDTGHKIEQLVGSGSEIVREELVCQRCANIHKGIITPAKG